MNVIWARGSATVPEIHAAINEQRTTDAAYTTVLTFVQRLHARKLLDREPEGRTFRYTAAQSRDELLATWSDEMIDRLIDDYGPDSDRAPRRPPSIPRLRAPREAARGTAEHVTEHPDFIFGAVLIVAATAAAALLGVLVEIGLQGVAGIAAVSAGLVTACILLAFELRDLPPALVLVSITAIASLVALARALHGVWCEQRLIRALPAVALADSCYHGIVPTEPGVDVYVLGAHWQGAFCGGVLRPKVVVTTELLDALDPAERGAVVTHELSHARSRGPLKLVLGQLVVRSFFWVPVLRDLVDRYLLLTEIAADRAAIAATSPAALAGALSQVLETPKMAGSIGFADHAAARGSTGSSILMPSSRAWSPPPESHSRELTLGAAGVLVYSSPRLTSSQSEQLHTMTVNLLQHHLQARLIGFALTVVIVTGAIACVRRLARRPR